MESRKERGVESTVKKGRVQNGKCTDKLFTTGKKGEGEDKEAELGIILGAKAMIEIIGFLTQSHD